MKNEFASMQKAFIHHMKIISSVILLCSLSTVLFAQGTTRTNRGDAKNTATPAASTTDTTTTATGEKEDTDAKKEKPATTGIRFLCRGVDRKLIPDAFYYDAKTKKWSKATISGNNPRDRYPLTSSKVTLYQDTPRANKPVPDAFVSGDLPSGSSNRITGLISMKEGKANLSFFDEAKFYTGGVHFVSTVPNLTVKIIIGDKAPIEVTQTSPLHLDFRGKPSLEAIVAIFYKTPNGAWTKLSSFISQSSTCDAKITLISWDEKRKRPRMENYTLFDERSNYNLLYNNPDKDKGKATPASK